MKPNVYSPKTLAREWACSEHHVRNLIARGQLPAFRLGGKLLRITVAAAEGFMKNHAILGEPAGDHLTTVAEPVNPVDPIRIARIRARRLDQ